MQLWLPGARTAPPAACQGLSTLGALAHIGTVTHDTPSVVALFTLAVQHRDNGGALFFIISPYRHLSSLLTSYRFSQHRKTGPGALSADSYSLPSQHVKPAAFISSSARPTLPNHQLLIDPFSTGALSSRFRSFAA